MKIGDMVVPKSSDHQLASGCQRYGFAVVAQLDPFVLISEHADMLWRWTVEMENFKVIGTAPNSMLEACLMRLERTPVSE